MKTTIAILLFAAALFGQTADPTPIPAYEPYMPTCCFGAMGVPAETVFQAWGDDPADITALDSRLADAVFDQAVLREPLAWETSVSWGLEINLGGDVVYRCKANEVVPCLAEAIGTLLKKNDALEARIKALEEHEVR